MIESSYQDIGDDFIEDIYKYVHAKRGVPEEVPLPEVIDILSSLVLPKRGPFFTQYNQTGVMLGEGWKDSGVRYDHIYLARTAAYTWCRDRGDFTLVAGGPKPKRASLICLYFNENGKTFIWVPTTKKIDKGKDNKWWGLKQEIVEDSDSPWGEITVEALEDLERRLGS